MGWGLVGRPGPVGPIGHWVGRVALVVSGEGAFAARIWLLPRARVRALLGGPGLRGGEVEKTGGVGRWPREVTAWLQAWWARKGSWPKRKECRAGWKKRKERKRKKWAGLMLGWIERKNSKRDSRILATEFDLIQKISKDFEIQSKVWTVSKLRIWTLVQGFKSKDFEIQTKTNLDSNERFWITEIWIQLEILNSRKDLNSFKDQNLTKGDFEIVWEIKNWLGSKMKFESFDLNQRIFKFQARFWLKELFKFRKV
jgi:hypothetical protein